MDATRLEFLCQVGIVVFGVATAGCAFGTYYFGARASDETTRNQTAKIVDGVNQSAETIKSEIQSNNEDIQESLRGIEEAVRELKNATVTGTPKLVEAFDDRTEWDFAQGTFEFLMLEKALLENEPLLLNVVSRDNKRLLKIELDSFCGGKLN